MSSPLEWPAAVGILFFLLLLSAFFSGSETALTRARRFRLRLLSEQGDRGARKAEQLLDEPERMLTAILVGNNFVNIAASSLATAIFVALYGEAGILYATLAMTVVVVILAEILPKTIAVAHAERMACRAAPVLGWLMRLLAPLTGVLTAIIAGLQRLLAIPKGSEVELTHQELAKIIDVSAESGVLDAAREQMLLNSLHLHQVPVKALMTPRKDMDVLDASMRVSECLRIAIARPHSRYPVFEGTEDHLIGIVHLRDLVRHRDSPLPLRDAVIWRDLPFVPANKNALQQLFDFQSHHQHMAIVVDEYGDIDGLITMEDILEEIVGEIEDESDRPAPPDMWPQPDGSLVADGTVSVHDINQSLDIQLPEEGATTIGGLIVERMGAQPEAAMCLQMGGARLEVMEMEEGRITRVRIAPDRGEG